MRLRLASASSDPPQSPERRALADAIAALAAVDEEQRSAWSAMTLAADRVDEARAAVTAAEERLAQAKAAAARHLQAVVLGTAGEPPATIRSARSALTDAEDDLETARAAETALAPILAEAERSRPYRQTEVLTAARAVLAAELRPVALALAAKVQQLQRDMVDAGFVLRWMRDVGALPTIQDAGPMYRKVADGDIRQTVYRLDTPPNYWRELISTSPGAQSWEAAFQALQRDANAPLPK